MEWSDVGFGTLDAGAGDHDRGLVVGAAGIAILWAAGVDFPVAVPPGIVILVAGALFVGLAPWRWAAAVGVLLGLFITGGS